MDVSIRQNHRMRDRILKLLTDDEVARVSTLETAERLALGGEYIDLGRPDLGVQTAGHMLVPMHRILPRQAVSARTWGLILAGLAEAWDVVPRSDRGATREPPDAAR
jgi:hypothetical protein